MKITPAKRLEGLVVRAMQESYLTTLLPFVRYEQGSSTVVSRMPDLPAFGEIWSVIERVAKENGVRVIRRGKWPTAAELDKLLGDIKWLWQPWIPYGFVTMLVGEPGSGKSFLALDWSDRAIKGIGWPLSTVVRNSKSRNSIWIETESSQQLVTSRSRTMGLNQDMLIMPGFGEDMLGQPDLVLEEHRNRIVSAVEDIKPAMLVVDSLGGAHTGGENKIEEVRPMLDFLARLSRDEKIPTVAIHHLRKRSAGETIEVSMDRVRGSSAFSAFARSIIAVEGNETRNIRVIKANLAEKPEPLTFTLRRNKEGKPQEIQYVAYVPPQRKKNKAEKCAEWVTGQLREKEEGVRLKDLIQMGEPHGYTRSLLYRAQSILSDSISVQGNGNTATWSIHTIPDLDLLCENGDEK